METLSRRGFVKGMAAAAAVAAVGASRPPSAKAAERADGLRFGIQLRPEHTSYAALLRAWQESEALGYDMGFVFDHFMPIDGRPGPCLEGWTLLAALAAQSHRLRVGVLVTGNTYRFPALLAKMAATVDEISNGRLILGMGAGWFEAEHTAYGIPFYTAGQRAHRLVEAVKVVQLLFTQDRSTFSGRYYTLSDAPFDPRGIQRPHPPILIGGMGPKVIRPLAARHADIWNFSVRDGDPAEARKTCSDFDDLCRKVGREPKEVAKSVNLRPTQVTGPPREVRERLRALADAGVQHFVLSLPAPYDSSLLRTFAKEVVPALRQG
jgi:F420-dependent oxidoreductase-like protein